MRSEKRKCEHLLEEFIKKNKDQKFRTEKIKFEGVEGYDVYNIASPFSYENEEIIPGRVEKRDSEHSEIRFFKKTEKNIWKLIENAPTFKLQDPFYTFIDGDMVLGGVEIYENPEVEGTLLYRTIFLKGENFYNLKRVANGPNGMKDIRLCQMKNNKIAVFTRPQGTIGGRGTIGYVEISSLEELNSEVINSAKLLTEHFYSQEWGGGNEIHELKNGLLGVLSHIAKFDSEGNRHYYPSYFIFDPSTREYTNMELIGYRGLFEKGDSKRLDLEDVVFSGGLKRMTFGKAILYAGISDAEAHWIEIEDPFKKWEN